MDKDNIYDVLIIGGGLLGCFTARNLMGYRLRVALLERNPDICMEISRANTAIIYSGYDTKPGTPKTKFTLAANRGFEKLCQELDVDFSRPGSLMLAYGKKGVDMLEEKLQQGKKNGLKNLRLLNNKEALAIEPNLNPSVLMALYSPDTATVNPWQLGISAMENAVENGAELFLNHEVCAINKTSYGFEVNAAGNIFKTKMVINCAGLSCDKVSELIAKPYFRIIPTRGEYLVLDTKAAGSLRHILFQEREENRKGISFVPTTEGNILIGASQSPADENNFNTTIEGQKGLKEQAKLVLPSIPLEYIIRSFGSLRPNPFWLETNEKTGETSLSDKKISSFIIDTPQDIPGLINLLGIKTPGLTCADEIGKYITTLVVDFLGSACLNPMFTPNINQRIRFSRLSFEEKQTLVEKEPAYGNIICRCNQISEGEIIAAIRMKVGAKSVDGVKRRAGTCQGRCQGSFCQEKILEILSRELGISINQINKDTPGSYFLNQQRSLC